LSAVVKSCVAGGLNWSWAQEIGLASWDSLGDQQEQGAEQ